MRKAMMIAAAMLVSVAAPALAQAPVESWDGLVEVRSPRMDAAFLRPGADFRRYAKVMIDTPEAAFHPNWMRDMNRGGRRMSDRDAERILASVVTDTGEIFANEFRRAGYEVVTRPGPGVLRVRTAVVNLFINAPDMRNAGRSRTYTVNAGEATLILETRDSLTRALLARAIDRRQTRGMSGPTNRVTNTAEFRSLATRWAQISASKLGDLKAASPIPDPLTPGQRIN